LPIEENSHQHQLQPRRYTAAAVIASDRQSISKSHPEACGDKPNKLIGLALSGGGIRSATINLGLLQALARAHILEKVAYLLTVSGAGYIGFVAGGVGQPRNLIRV
jgi:hypothetical protein